MINLLVLLSLSFSAWAKLDLEVAVPIDSVRQGEIVDAKIVIRPIAGQSLILPALKGKKIADTIYFFSASPLIGKEGQGFYESDAKVIFLKVPQSNTASETINGEEISVTWNQVQVTPTETQKSFLLGDFEIPLRRKFFIWILSFLGAMAVSGIGYKLWKKFEYKGLARGKLRNLKNDILGCKSYEEVVLLWRNKKKYVEVFPQTMEHFQKLEQVLFKYQFKANQTESEIDEVMSAYKEFCLSVQGSLNGI